MSTSSGPPRTATRCRTRGPQRGREVELLGPGTRPAHPLAAASLLAMTTTRTPARRQGLQRRTDVQLPAAEELRRLKLSPEVAWYLLSRGIPLPDCPPAVKSPEPGELLKSARFDPERVDRVIRAFERLRHTQGRLAGKPLRPDPWQIAYILAPVFGWVKYDRKAQRWLRVIRTAFIEICRKNGKALDVETPILTSTGWSTMGALAVGDRVHGPDGSLTKVRACSKVFTDHDCYSVTFSDGQSIVADAGHLWRVRDRCAEREVTVTTEQMAGRYLIGSRSTHRERRYSLRLPSALHRPTSPLPINPYVLGAWLGDGETACARITGNDPGVFAELAAAGYSFGAVSNRGLCRNVLGLYRQLRLLGVLGAKHVPSAYLLTDAASRLALLQGLMDTDGSVIRGKDAPRCEFTNTNRGLADAVLFLARSLGWKATMREGRAMLNGRDCGPRYRVSWCAYHDESPFRLPRKTSLLAQRGPRPARSRSLQVVGVEPVPRRAVRCIEVARPDGLYLAGRGLVTTHNSTIVGGILLYLACADGEQGAQVLTAATSERQAGYVFDPVKQLAKSSPSLKPYVKPLAKKIIHPATGSYLEVVSSRAGAEHGGNIHGAGIDELHTHKSPDIVDAIETGTGSRDQPLIVFITTADDGTPGTVYDRKRKRIEQLAKRVFRDATTYGVIWCADERDDPFSRETLRKANPGAGISPTWAFLDKQASEARTSPATLSRYLRLHLGIRAKQTARYVRLAAWDASPNAQMVVESQLRGRRCFGGLDLSAVEDMTALCWEFPTTDPDGVDAVDVLWRFWLPAARIDDLNWRTAGEADVWVREGRLTLTPGNVIDLKAITKAVEDDAQYFGTVVTIGYDRWSANPVVTDLGDAGLLCVPRGQGYASASAPLKDILRLVLTGRYRHGGNPIMRWMTDNLTVAMDTAGNVKPDKAKAADKIDGWSAAVTAHGEAMDNATAAEQEEGPAPTPPVVAHSATLSETADVMRIGF